MYRYYNKLMEQNKTLKIISLTFLSFAVIANFSTVAKQADEDLDSTFFDMTLVRDAYSEINHDISSLFNSSIPVTIKNHPIPEIPPII